MVISVDKNTCIGCGTCVALCSQVFKLNDQGKSEVIGQEDVKCAKKAQVSCPVNAISVS